MSDIVNGIIPSLTVRHTRSLSPAEAALAQQLNAALVGANLSDAAGALTFLLVRALVGARLPRAVFLDTLLATWDAVAKDSK